MTKNNISEIDENETESVSALADVLAGRLPIPCLPHNITTLHDVVWLLDIMKKGLVTPRGGRFKDNAFLILDSNLDTEYIHSILRPTSIEVQLVKPGHCSPFFQSFFYEPDRKRRVGKKEQEAWFAQFGEHLDDFVVEKNHNYVPGRALLRVPLDSASSAIYLVLAYLELILDSFSVKCLADIPAKVALDAYCDAAGWKVGDFVRNAKYITAYPIAKFLQQDVLPEKPSSLESHNLFRGAIAKIIRARLISRRDHKAARFFFGLLQGVKRACNIIPKEFIEKSKEKHLLTLTTPSSTIDEEYLSGQFSILSTKLWRGIKLTSHDILRWTEPSKNAAYTHTRLEGGQDTVVRESLEFPTRPDPDDYPKVDDIRDDPEPYLADDDDFLFVDSLPQYQEIGSYHVRSSLYSAALSTISYFSELHSIHESDVGLKELRGVRLGYSEKRQLLKKIYQDTKFLNEPIQCSIVPLAEPLKVRTISAGEGLPYYMAKPFQKAAWKWLRNFPQFTVIGEPLSSDILSRMIDRESLLQRYIDERKKNQKTWHTPFRDCPTDFFVSGDYSAATDNLKIEYTLQTFDTLSIQLKNICRTEFNQDMDVLSEYLYLCRRLLEPHDLVYNDKKGLLEQICLENKIPYQTLRGGFISVLQRNGQLMGSPISFPFLCAINFICYWTSINRFIGVHCPHRLLPVLINGDDILFRSNVDHYKIWKEVISEVGFTLSLGKNYTHPSYLTINSELYEFRTRPDQEEFLKLEYFNVGLLIAQSKGRLADPRRKLSLVELYAQSVGCSINKLQAHLRFLHYNKEQINQATDRGKYNMFLPIQYGGLGFPVYEEIKNTIYITKFQRQFATFLLKRTNESLSEGIYPKKYFSALLTDTTPLASIIRRHGFPRMMLSINQSQVGWKRYVQPTAKTMGPLSAVQEISLDPTSEYRLPSRSLLKEFNKYHFTNLNTPISDTLPGSLTDDELLLGNKLILWVEDFSPPLVHKTWLPS
jgi:hypothetical protein